MRKIEPLSLIVFIIGLVLAITGITLAIVFGVQGSKSCPSCQCPAVAACSARLFTVRTGLQDASWTADLDNPSTEAFKKLANTTSIQMQSSLQASQSVNSKSFVLAAAASNDNNVIVQVTKFILASDRVTVIAVASAGIVGPATSIQILPNDTDTSMQNALVKDNTTFTDPVVDNNSMTFCQNPYTNLSDLATDAPPTATLPCVCPTLQPVENVTCPTLPAPTHCPDCNCPVLTTLPSPTHCPVATELPCPTDCPLQVCPSPSEPTQCDPCPSVSTESSSTPATTCPTPVEPPACPSQVEPTECNCNTDATITAATSCPTSFEHQTCPTQPVPTDCNCPTSSEQVTCPTETAPTDCNCPIVTEVPAVTACPTNPPSTSFTTLQTSPQTIQTITSAQTISSSTDSPAATSTAQQTATVIQQTTNQPSSTSQAARELTSPTISTTGTPVATSTTGQPTIATSTVPAQSSTGISSTQSSITQSSISNTDTTVTVPTVTQTATSTVSLASSSATVTQPTSAAMPASASTYQVTEASSMSSQASTGTTLVTETTTIQETSAPSSTVYSTMQTSCPGYSVYKGDIAIVYEQLSSKVVPSQATVSPESSTTPEPPVHYIDIELFIASQLMGYGGNPYDLPGGNTRALLAPYPKTESYNTIIQGNYAGTPKSVAELNATMYRANAITVATPADFTGPVIVDGLTAVQNANDHSTNYGVLVIIGFSSQFAAAAAPLATSLRDNYHVFTVSFDATQDFSSLASDAQSFFTLTKPSDSAAARAISMNIAQFAVSKSSECISTTIAVPTTKRKQTTMEQTTQAATTNSDLTTTVPLTTTEYCPNKFINQDIAIVWEESSSTGDYTLSNNVNVFLQTLIPQIEQNLMVGTDVNWSPITNLSLVEYPEPATYGTTGSFGTVQSSTYLGILGMIQTLGAGNNNANSDINSGLVAAQTAFATLSSGRKQTIILFANVAAGVGGATATATTLKTNGVTIITVAAVTAADATLPLYDLSSGAEYELNLDTTNQTRYRDVANQVVQLLTGISTQCCSTLDCYKPTTPVATTLATTSAVPSSSLVTVAYQSTATAGPTSSIIRTTSIPTTSACYGNYAFNGDISIVYELTDDNIKNGKEAQIESFITGGLLAYSGYQIDGVTSRILLSPYGFTTNYYAPGATAAYSIVSSLSNSKTFIDSYNNVCSALGATSLAIKDGIDFTGTATDHTARTGAVVIIGYSSSGVVDAQPSVQTLKDQGYEVFTVSFDATQPLDVLATQGGSYNRNTVDDEGDIAKNIGDYLMSVNSVCMPPQTTLISTTTTTFTTTVAATTTEYCPNKYINQDISIVWEESSSTGGFTVSNNVNLFLQTLIPQIASNMANPLDTTWSSVTNMSLVEYPNPASYGTFGPFGTITSGSLAGILDVITVLGTNEANTMSDITSGLQFAQTELAALSSGRKQTIILFANVGSGVGGAIATANNLKTSGVTIITVAAVTRAGDTIPLSDLSSGANYELNLNTANTQGFSAVAAKIVQALGPITTQCCLSTDCTTT